jgi:hypothetical protein
MATTCTPIPTEETDHPLARIRIDDGPFKGVVFQIGAVSFPTMETDSTVDKDGNVPIHIETNIFEIPEELNRTIEDIGSDPEFHTITGELVCDSIAQMLDETDAIRKDIQSAKA